MSDTSSEQLIKAYGLVTRTWTLNEKNGYGCAECCNGDRCDEDCKAKYKGRRKDCPHCKGKGWIPKEDAEPVLSEQQAWEADAAKLRQRLNSERSTWDLVPVLDRIIAALQSQPQGMREADIVKWTARDAFYAASRYSNFDEYWATKEVRVTNSVPPKSEGRYTTEDAVNLLKESFKESVKKVYGEELNDDVLAMADFAGRKSSPAGGEQYNGQIKHLKELLAHKVAVCEAMDRQISSLESRVRELDAPM